MAPSSSGVKWTPRVDSRERHSDVHRECCLRFEHVSRIREAWGVFNGSDVYKLGGIHQSALVLALIEEMALKETSEQPNQKRIYNIIDIGAGEFQWGRAIANYINANASSEIKDKIQVNIFSVRGEPLALFHQKEAQKELDEICKDPVIDFSQDNNELSSKFDEELDKISRLLPLFLRTPTQSTPSEMDKIEEGICHVHNCGAFQIEKIRSEFKRLGFDLERKVHFAISHMSLYHLGDPLGTFADITELLAPEDGYALVDGFTFNMEIVDPLKTRNRSAATFTATNEHLLQLMTETNLAFLRMVNKTSSNHSAVLIRRKDDTPPEIKMAYEGIDQAPPGTKPGASKILVHFVRFDPLPTLSYSFPPEMKDSTFESTSKDKNVFVGHRELFTWLQEKNLFKRTSPIFVETSASVE